MSDVAATAMKIIANVEKVIIGKRQQVVLSLVAYFSEGHILLEDVPGVAKTMLARALARSVGCSFTEDRVAKATLLQKDSEVRMVEEACEKVAIEGSPFQLGEQMVTQLPDILRGQVRQPTILQPTPDHLVGVQGRGIGRQVFQHDILLSRQPSLDQARLAVDVVPVPNHRPGSG